MTLARIAIVTACIATPLLAASGNRQVIEITSTQNFPFQPGGAIHIEHSYGQLSIEGWDKPEVEVTIVKSPDELYAAKDQAEAAKRVENVKVTVNRTSESQMDIDTAVSNFSRWTHPFGPLGGVTMQYRIRVPRDSKLVIHHGHGEVLVNQVVGDIEATGERGDIVLLLSEKEKYAIDAKSKMGTVSSDFDGDFAHGWFAHSYAEKSTDGSHRIFVREGAGGIEIKSSPAEAQPPTK